MATTHKFYHRVPGAKFYLQGATPGIVRELSFPGGLCETDDQQAIEELSKIANLPGSMVFTTDKELVVDIGEQQAAEDVMATAVSAFDNENKIPPGAKTVEIPMAPNPKPVLPGTLADKAAAARAAIAATQGKSNTVSIPGGSATVIKK